MKVNYVNKISGDEMFNDLLNYNCVIQGSPIDIDNDPKEGTWIVDYEDSNSTIKVYHCKNINDKLVWLKLPTIRYMESSLFISTSTLMALRSIFDEFPNDLKCRISELLNR